MQQNERSLTYYILSPVCSDISTFQRLPSTEVHWYRLQCYFTPAPISLSGFSPHEEPPLSLCGGESDIQTTGSGERFPGAAIKSLTASYQTLDVLGSAESGVYRER